MYCGEKRGHESVPMMHGVCQPGLMGMAIFHLHGGRSCNSALGSALQNSGTADILSCGGLGPSSRRRLRFVRLWIADLPHTPGHCRIDGRGSCAPPGLLPGHDFGNHLFCIVEHIAVSLSAYGCACHGDDAILAGEVSPGLHQRCFRPGRRDACMGANHCISFTANLFH